MIVSANRLSVDLEGTTVLSDLDFEVSRGCWVGLLGPNGAGKTTVLRTIAGLVPYEGHLRVADREVNTWSRRDLARTLAFVRQSVPLAFDFRVADLVMLGRSPHAGWLAAFGESDRTIVERALDRVDLTGLASRSIHSLSSGEQQRVFLAQALAQEPDLLLLDEPTAHLDIRHQFEFLNLVHEYVESGRTAIAAFHDLELAAQYADVLLILNRGSVAALGPPAEALTSDIIADVFGVDATVTRDRSAIADIRYHYRPGSAVAEPDDTSI